MNHRVLEAIAGNSLAGALVPCPVATFLRLVGGAPAERLLKTGSGSNLGPQIQKYRNK